MNLITLLATPVTLFLPSRSIHVSLAKLTILGMIVTTFFLFTAGYVFPGGGLNFILWADAIVHGTTLPPRTAWREVGFPLLYVLSGFPWNHSFIGITIILAQFAILMPLLVYWCLVRASRVIAFYAGLICILSLAPVMYMKFLFHDQAYMFFGLLAIALLIEFLWRGQFLFLAFFSIAALAVSFTRTAGNLIYPMLMAVAFVTVRGRLIKYAACVMIFVAGAALNQWHRYVIFDMRNQSSTPSGTGGQIFYSMYLYMADFGYQLTPDIGPNTKYLLDQLTEQLEPNVRESALIKRALIDTPPDFMERYVYSYSPSELVEKIETEPTEEYYMILLYVNPNGPNDQLYRGVVKEIALSHPWYVLQYTMRNLWHSLFDPGYASTRYNTRGYIKTGIDFVPGLPSWGVNSADSAAQYGSRPERELEYFPLMNKPQAVQTFFQRVGLFWRVHYDRYVWITSVPIMIAWIGAILGASCWVVPGTAWCRTLTEDGINKLMAPLIATSATLLYEDLSTAMFSQPVYRYFHMTEPLRLVIGGYGVLMLGVFTYDWRRRIAQALLPGRLFDLAGTFQKYDFLENVFGPRRTQLILGLIALNVAVFVWWASRTIAHTWA
jgi:hypothetical protein